VAQTETQQKSDAAEKRRAARDNDLAQRRAEAAAKFQAEEFDRIQELAKTDPAAADEAMRIFEGRQRAAAAEALNAQSNADETEDVNFEGGSDFEDVSPGESQNATQTLIVQDPNMMRQVQGAQARAKAVTDRLDFAPNGGVYLRSDGSYVNADGQRCNKDGSPVRE
jgi:hypothetical protein